MPYPSGSRLVLERQGDGAFAALETNRTVRVDADTVDQLLRPLSALSALKYVTYNPRDLSLYGLQEPSMELYIGLTGTNHLGRILLIGHEAAQGFYAMVKGDDVVFILEKEFVETMSGGLLTDGAEATPSAEQ